MVVRTRWYGIKCIQISGYKDPSLFPFLGTSNIDSIVYQEDFEDLNYSGSNENGIIVNSDLKNSDYSLRGPNANSFNWVQTTSNSLPTDVSAISFWAKLMIDSSKNPYILEFRDYNNSSVNKELSFYYDISNSRLMLHDQVTPGTSVINTLYINGIRRNIPTTFNASGNEVIPIIERIDIISKWCHFYIDFTDDFNFTKLTWLTDASGVGTGSFLDNIHMFNERLDARTVHNIYNEAKYDVSSIRFISSKSTLKDTPAPPDSTPSNPTLIDINRLDLKYTPNTTFTQQNLLSSVDVKVPSFEYKGRGTYNITGDKFHTLFDVSMAEVSAQESGSFLLMDSSNIIVAPYKLPDSSPTQNDILKSDPSGNMIFSKDLSLNAVDISSLRVMDGIKGPLSAQDISADAVDISSLKVLDNYIDSSGIRYLGVPVYDVSFTKATSSYSMELQSENENHKDRVNCFSSNGEYVFVTFNKEQYDTIHTYKYVDNDLSFVGQLPTPDNSGGYNFPSMNMSQNYVRTIRTVVSGGDWLLVGMPNFSYTEQSSHTPGIVLAYKYNPNVTGHWEYSQYLTFTDASDKCF